jgi:hypothetical protein
MLARGVAVFILNEDKFKLRSYSIYWPERVAVLIAQQEKLYLNPFQYIGQRG